MGITKMPVRTQPPYDPNAVPGWFDQAQLPQGTLRFGSITGLRNHIQA